MRSLFQSSQTFLQDHFLLLIGVCLACYFSVHAIGGQRSVFTLMSLHKECTIAFGELDALSDKKNKLESKVFSLRAESIDLDFLEELAITQLGYVKPTEIMILDAK